ncbi:unnamed protein product [Tetraodon nigroviridis]|uniref:(spotted green pufferfish) hypothetical protein n=1 Tax=Tetraodon nigroviridis TaxID=99883 RepID=Q4RG16_TETNG|nr:unnamed protein product [Tetraodon nigroviridis]
MLKQQQQPGSGGRKTSNGTSGPSAMSSPVSGVTSGNRTPDREYVDRLFCVSTVRGLSWD